MILLALTLTISLNPDTTVCQSHPMSGWTRLKTNDKAYVIALARQGKLEITEAQSLTCIDYSSKELKKVFLREQWWRKVK